MVNIAVCDDDITFCNLLKNLLKQNVNFNVHIDTYDSSLLLLDSIDKYDVLFVDYDMPNINGIDILNEIKNKTIIKIMVSNHSHMCFEVFEYEVFWFVRKQKLLYDLKKLIPNLVLKINNNTDNFVLSTSNKYISIKFDDIEYLETRSNYIYITTRNDTYKIRSTFSSIVSQFEEYPFVIPSHGVLININNIAVVDFHCSTITLKNGKMFSISRSKKEEVRKKYGKYINL